jgi:hypothetical protein
MPVRRWEDHETELRLARERTRRQTEAQAWARTQPATFASHARTVMTRQPTLRPGLALAAAAAAANGMGDAEEFADLLARGQVKTRRPELGRPVAAQMVNPRAADWLTSDPFGGARSALRSALGEVVKPVADVASSVGGELNNRATRAVVRGAITAFDVGPQLVQGAARIAHKETEGWNARVAETGDRVPMPGTGLLDQIRGIPGQVGEWADQTDLGQVAGAWLRGDEVDLGEGFLPDDDSDIVVRRKAAESRYATIDGHTVNYGRWFANEIFEPGTRPYDTLSGLLDGSIALFTPSLDRGLDVAARGARQGARTATGAVSADDYLPTIGGYGRGRYRTVDPVKAEQFLTSNRGGRMASWLAEQTGDEGIVAIWERTGRKLDPEFVAQLADETDPAAVQNLLAGAVHEGARPELGGRFGFGVRQATAGMRLFGQVPPTSIDLEDGSQSARAVADFFRNVKAPERVRTPGIASMLRAGSPIQRREAYHGVLRATVADILLDDDSRRVMNAVEAGEDVAPDAAARAQEAWDEARRLTQYMSDEAIGTPRAQLDEMVANGWADDFSVHLGGKSGREYRVQGAHLLVEAAEVLPMPSSQELRRFTSMMAPMWRHAQAGRLAGGVTGMADSVNFFWKTSMLARGAYPVRVVALEEQLRMAAAGYASVWTHPIAYFGLINADAKRARFLAKRGRLDVDALGQSFDESDDFLDALAQGGRLTDAPRGRRGDFVTTPKTAPGFLRDWAEELATHASDPIVAMVARAESLDEVMEYLGHVPGRTPVTGPKRQRFLDDLAALGVDVDNPMALRAYLESVQRRLQYVTGGHPELQGMVAAGKARALNGLDLTDFLDAAPPNVQVRGRLPDDKVKGYDRAVEVMFDLLASKPTNRFSRSPVYRQAYARRLIENASLAADPDAVRAAAKRMKFNRDEMVMLEASLGKRADGVSDLTLEHLDRIAHRHGLDETRDLLYDLHNRSQFFTATRLIFPFGEAWKEVMTTWLNLFAERPGRITRTAGVLARGLTNPLPDSTSGMLGTPEDQGFVYENENGELVFAYPWSEQLTEAVAGVPWRMEGRAQGMNLVGEVLPGAGYLAQVPLAALTPDDAEWDGVRDLLFPFGEPGSPRDPSSWAPSFVRTLLRPSRWTSEDARLHDNMVMAVFKYEASTGEYDLNGPDAEEQQRALLERAERTGGVMTWVLAAAKFIAPSSPNYAQTVWTPDDLGPRGELVGLYSLANHYREMQREDPDGAMFRMIEEIGTHNAFLTTSNTTATVHGGVPLHGEGFRWVRDNNWVSKEHPQVYGFFAPRSVSSAEEFDYSAYTAAIERGEIETLTNAEKLALQNHRNASVLMRTYRAQATEAEEMGEVTKEEAREWVVEQELMLQRHFPGFNAVDRIGTKTSVATEIDRGVIDRALTDERFMEIADPDVVEPLRIYWDLRAQAIEYAEDLGETSPSAGRESGWRAAKGTEGAALEARTWLRTQGDQLATDFPAFAELWDSFLSREFKVDEIEVED